MHFKHTFAIVDKNRLTKSPQQLYFINAFPIKNLLWQPLLSPMVLVFSNENTCYGSISLFHKTPISKYKLAVTDDDLFKNFIKLNPINLNTSITTMLIDLNTNSIINECDLSANKPQL